MATTFDLFLTAYDPSDLPGGTVDPLGFDRAYEHFAGKLLPGLTNVANRPRYHAMMCAALVLCDEAGVASGGREAVTRRTEAILRFERIWALAALRTEGGPPDGHGLRGIRYVQAASQRLDERDDKEATPGFQLLAGQATAGALGIYGAVANGLNLIDRQALQLWDLGRALGSAFLDETCIAHKKLRGWLHDVVLGDGAIALKHLAAWGELSAPWVPAGASEKAVLRQALDANPTRQRMAIWLRDHPYREGESELERLARAARASAASNDPDLVEAVRAILPFERAYRGLTLVLQRVLWACQHQEPFSVSLDDEAFAAPLVGAHDALREAHVRLQAAVDEAVTPAFRHGTDRLDDARAVIREAAEAGATSDLLKIVVRRHTVVQRRRGVGGRGKLPWVELEGGRLRPTLAAAQRIPREPIEESQMSSHEYRTYSCDAFEMAEVAS